MTVSLTFHGAAGTVTGSHYVLRAPGATLHRLRIVPGPQDLEGTQLLDPSARRQASMPASTPPIDHSARSRGWSRPGSGTHPCPMGTRDLLNGCCRIGRNQNPRSSS
jgi:hypothetical protein